VRGSRAAQLAFMAAAFVVAALIAKATGARWGVALAFGQIAFVAAVVTVLLTDEPSPG
jgi:hypothetical protein